MIEKLSLTYLRKGLTEFQKSAVSVLLDVMASRFNSFSKDARFFSSTSVVDHWQIFNQLFKFNVMIGSFSSDYELIACHDGFQLEMDWKMNYIDVEPRGEIMYYDALP